MRIGSPIWHTFRIYVIRKIVAATVCYGAITTSELWKMFYPHSIVLKAAVNKYHGLALAHFYVSKLCPSAEIRLISSAIAVAFRAALRTKAPSVANAILRCFMPTSRQRMLT